MNRQFSRCVRTTLLSAWILSAPLALGATDLPAWVAKDADWAKSKATLQAYGDQFPTSDAMFEALKATAKGGKSLTWQQLAQDSFDWTGVYTRSGGGLEFDPDVSSSRTRTSAEPPATTARLSAAGLARFKEKAEALFRTKGEYDPISDCRPPGTPRWFSEPFLREFAITPKQTWLMNEMVNDVRRVYTDGRAHTPEEDAFGSPNGDTVGFWNGDVLTTHTNTLTAGEYQRGVQPDFSDQTSTVERWHKVGPKTIEVDVWVFDPVNLAKPWYTRQSYTRLTNDDHSLRIRYWNCSENPNNVIVKKPDGTSDFGAFGFEPGAPVRSSDDAKKTNGVK